MRRVRSRYPSLLDWLSSKFENIITLGKELSRVSEEFYEVTSPKTAVKLVALAWMADVYVRVMRSQQRKRVEQRRTIWPRKIKFIDLLAGCRLYKLEASGEPLISSRVNPVDSQREAKRTL